MDRKSVRGFIRLVWLSGCSLVYSSIYSMEHAAMVINACNGISTVEDTTTITPEKRVTDQGSETLLTAVARGDKGRIRELLALNTPVNICNKEGYTPLMYAVIQEEKDLVLVLLEAGAQANAPTNSGVTALDIAQFKEYEEIQDLLIYYGAQLPCDGTAAEYKPVVSCKEELSEEELPVSAKNKKGALPAKKYNIISHDRLVCTVCNKQYANKSSLKNHKKIRHEGTKSFKCDKCPYTSYEKAHLVRHQHRCALKIASLVTDTVPTNRSDQCMCTVCQSMCADEYALKQHTNHEHKDDALGHITCGICSTTYGNTSALKRHQQEVHRGIKRVRYNKWD